MNPQASPANKLAKHKILARQKYLFKANIEISAKQLKDKYTHVYINNTWPKELYNMYVAYQKYCRQRISQVNTVVSWYIHKTGHWPRFTKKVLLCPCL